ncbi:hypothetical protein MKX01_019547 [Papaver californicum]|nr:hypothetical protein MKX01_019547 [Papaver californicum]
MGNKCLLQIHFPLLSSILLLIIIISSAIQSSSCNQQITKSKINKVCIIGSGISGSSLSHFLRKYSDDQNLIGEIHIFERNGIVGGRTATVTIGGDTFEAGGSIIHPKNYHALNFTHLLNLKIKKPSDADSLGIWDGSQFLVKTLQNKKNSKLISLYNSFRLFFRYGLSLLKMDPFIKTMLGNFLNYYADLESRPVFETVEEMLKWSNLYNLTCRTLQEELIKAGLAPKLISELITVITRINYGQSMSISGLAGAVSMAGSDDGLWAVEGGNWQIAAGLIKHSNVTLHLHEEIESVSHIEGSYELNSTTGNTYSCGVTVIATPLDEVKIRFSPPISIPERRLQHTHATFVRGILNPAYFGMNSIVDIPECVGTIEDPSLPFTSISVLKKYSKDDMTYKIFSRAPMEDALLDQLFRTVKEVIRINWGAYPHYHAPEVYAPFVLDRLHLYYVNAFENAASTIETGAVAAENVARLILSRYCGHTSSLSHLRQFVSEVHVEL